MAVEQRAPADVSDGINFVALPIEEFVYTELRFVVPPPVDEVSGTTGWVWMISGTCEKDFDDLVVQIPVSGGLNTGTIKFFSNWEMAAPRRTKYITFGSKPVTYSNRTFGVVDDPRQLPADVYAITEMSPAPDEVVVNFTITYKVRQPGATEYDPPITEVVPVTFTTSYEWTLKAIQWAVQQGVAYKEAKAAPENANVPYDDEVTL